MVVITKILILEVVETVLQGFVLSVLWGWFIAPTFGLPPISIVQGIGIALVLTVVTFQPPSGNEGVVERIVMTLAYGAAAPIIALVVGFFVHLFM